MLNTFQNSASVLSIGFFFTVITLGLSATLPKSLLTGLTHQGVPLAQATAGPYAAPIPYTGTSPCPSPYLVRTGDTLNIIGLRCNRSAASIAIANGIVNPNYIQVGQWLIIPTY